MWFTLPPTQRGTGRSRTVGWPRQQVNDLWEAIHEIPSLVTRWRPDAERELLMYLDEYDHKWPSPRLREMYQRHLEHGGPA
jgi:hypothetical protein